MPGIAENYSLGQSVEIGKIDKELKKLWREGEGAMTRASLINLAVYSEKPGSLEKNTQLIARIAENHACRALVIGANRNSKENRVEAWVNAHCHVSRAGNKQICSEQLSFSLEGPCVKLLPSIVFSHLDSDLPLYLWWQDDFPEPMDPQLWEWVDRLIFDSQTWRDFGAQMRLVETAQQEAKQRIVLCDLNWTRLDKVRYAIAQFFDHSASHHHFGKIENLNIDYAPGFKSTALFLIGWLIGEIAINSSGIQFRVAPAQCGDLLEISRSGENETALPQSMPAQSNDPVDLMTQELLRGGPHSVYLHAVNCVRELL